MTCGNSPDGTLDSWDSWAEYYDLIDIDRRAMIAFYQSLITNEIGSLVELGCGTGRILTAAACALHRRREHARIVGIDRSARMLRIARSRDERIEWVLGDMRSPPLSGSFDLVLCCFNTLQELLTEKDLNQMLDSVRRLTDPGGLFAFDIYQPNLSYLSTPRTNRLARSVVDGEGRLVEVREDYRYDTVSGVLTIDWRLVLAEGAECPPAPFRYYYRQYHSADIERLLGAAGFVVRERYGDFERSPFTSYSRKQIVVCRKASPTRSGQSPPASGR